MNEFEIKKPKYVIELYPFGKDDDSYIIISLTKKPLLFHRWMMSLLFGFKWKELRLNENE